MLLNPPKKNTPAGRLFADSQVWGLFSPIAIFLVSPWRHRIQTMAIDRADEDNDKKCHLRAEWLWRMAWKSFLLSRARGVAAGWAAAAVADLSAVGD